MAQDGSLKVLGRVLFFAEPSAGLRALLGMLLGLLCAATPVAEGLELAPGSMAPGLLDTNARGKNVSSDQRSPQLQQQQANSRGENVSSDQQTPLQKAIAASLAAIKAPATASDRAAPAAAALPAAAAAMSSSPTSAIPPSPAPRLPMGASVRVAPLNGRTAEGVSPVGVNETGMAVEHIILGLLFLGIVFFIIDCCGPELSRMFGCRRSRRWSATKGTASFALCGFSY